MSLPFWFLWIIGTLASYRLAFMFTHDTGPFEVFVRIRTAVYDRYGSGSWQYQGAQCALCQGVWYAGSFALLLFPWYGPVAQLALWLSMAGAQVLLQNVHWWLASQIQK